MIVTEENHEILIEGYEGNEGYTEEPLIKMRVKRHIIRIIHEEIALQTAVIMA